MMDGKLRIEPDSTRTAFGWLSLITFVIGMCLCDLAMTPGAPLWAGEATIWCGIANFFFLLFWMLMRAQDEIV